MAEAPKVERRAYRKGDLIQEGLKANGSLAGGVGLSRFSIPTRHNDKKTGGLEIAIPGPPINRLTWAGCLGMA
jgi:hypothetical protein